MSYLDPYAFTTTGDRPVPVVPEETIDCLVAVVTREGATGLACATIVVQRYIMPAGHMT